jgi:hypothetical protein
MKPVIYNQALSLKISESQRRAIERIADRKQMTLGNACRLLIDKGLEVIEI